MAGAAKGTVFNITIGTTLTPIAELTSIGGVAISADTIDVTALDTSDGYREFLQGWKDGGEVSLSGHLNESDAGQAGALAALESGAATSCTIVFPTAISASWAFDGIVTGFETGAELEDAVSVDITVKVTGKPTLS